MKYKRCTLTTIKGGTGLRDEIINGVFDHYPTVGESFIMIGKSVTKGGVARYISTSIVQDVKVDDNVFVFDTENSTYRLDIGAP